ncbi:MAG: hypothetical protein ACREXY_22090, partial [Gammaproteobacteria bacterium]
MTMIVSTGSVPEHWAIEKRSQLVNSSPGHTSLELRARLWTERAERRGDWKVLAAAVDTWSELGQAALKTLERAGAAALDDILTSLTNADPSQWKPLVELAAQVGGDGIYERLFKMIPRSPKHEELELHFKWAEVLRWIAIQAQPLGFLRANERRFRRELVARATPRSHRRFAAFSLSLIDGAENRAVLLDYLRRAGRDRSAILEELTASESDCARDVLREWDEISGNRVRREAQAQAEREESYEKERADDEIPRPASRQDVGGLLHEIVEHVTLGFGDSFQQNRRLEQLASIGPEVIPEGEAAIWSVIRHGESRSKFENAGLLCEA